MGMMSTNPACHSAIHAFCQQKYGVQQEGQKEEPRDTPLQVRVHKN